MDCLATSYVTRNKLEQEREQDDGLMWVQSGESAPGTFKCGLCQLLRFVITHAVRESIHGQNCAAPRLTRQKANGCHRTRNTGLEIDQELDHADLWVCRYTDMWECRFVGMQICG